MEKGKISIIIPVYNLEKYLSACIDSILCQKYKNLEIIIVNDGSTDSSKEICEEYQNKDQRVRVFSQNNSGVSVARNKGIKHATGDWIMFVDGDDLVDANLSEIIPQLDLENDVYMFAFTKIFGERKQTVGFGKQICFEKNDFENLQRWILNQYLYPINYVISSPCGKIYRRDFVMKNKCEFPANIKMGEDKIFNLQVFQYAQKGTYMDSSFYNYRVYQQSTVNKYSKDIVNTVENMLDKIRIFLEQYKKYEKFQDDYDIRIIMSIMYYIMLNFCHPKNSQKYSTRKAEFLNLVNQKKYSIAIKKVDGKKFPIRQRVLFVMIKAKWFWGIEQLNKLNRLYEKMKRS